MDARHRVQPPQPELLWTPAYWGWEGGRYLFHPGYRGREVGFYGIDYGFGYDGEGYFGDRSDHGVFFYNRTVNKITNVRNVCNQTASPAQAQRAPAVREPLLRAATSRTAAARARGREEVATRRGLSRTARFGTAAVLLRV